MPSATASPWGGELVLVGGNIGVGNNVTLSTIGQGRAPFDSASTGMGYSTGYGTSVLALSNGRLDFLGSQGTGAITIGAGSQLYSEGTLAFATNGGVNMDAGARFGSRNIALAMNTVNVGSSADIAAAGAPAGLQFDKALFNRLVSGDLPRGVPALQTITLGASSAINVFGSAGLDATGTGINLVLNTPALYGWGGAGDHATIAAGKITWNSIAGATPPALVASGPGTGLGTLDLVAREIDLGQFLSLDNTKVSRTVYGFGNVNLKASEKIVSAGNGSLFVYQAPSTDAGAVFGQSGSGGNLTLATPLLTGMQKSIMAYTAGGALNVVAPPARRRARRSRPWRARRSAWAATASPSAAPSCCRAAAGGERYPRYRAGRGQPHRWPGGRRPSSGPRSMASAARPVSTARRAAWCRPAAR